MLPLLSAARLVFWPLFALCNVEGTRLHVLFRGVVWPTFIMTAMALSNGYLSTLAMIYGPSRVEHRDAEGAGTVMVFGLTFGLFSGAMLSYLIRFVVLGE